MRRPIQELLDCKYEWEYANMPICLAVIFLFADSLCICAYHLICFDDISYKALEVDLKSRLLREKESVE